jgi:hypothetical protein
MSITRFASVRGDDAFPAVTVEDPGKSLVTKFTSHGEQVLVLRRTKLLSSSASPSVSIRMPSCG